MADDKLASYATRSVPRYTSYPTAPHFSDAVGAGTYGGWLTGLDPDEPVSLYLHVPYCRELCWYCGCNMKLARQDAPIAAYAKRLRAEIDLVAGHLPGRLKVSHLHWGGGTPTAMTPEDLAETMGIVARHVDITGDAELAIESDPRTLTDEMIGRIGALGFTRASFGVQEFDPTVQLAINRIQPPAMVRRAVDGLRGAGVGAINFDLIYGLPHQTTETLLQTIDLSLEMRPERIALFGYAHVPWMAKKQRMIDEAALPGPEARMEQAQASTQALEAAGYTRIGLDHFALPGDDMAIAARAGRLRRNFQGYTTDRAETLIGFGATSIGRTPFGYTQNIAEPGAWGREVEAGRLPVAKGVAFQGQDRLRGAVIEALMCQGVVDLDAAGRDFGAGPGWYADIRPELVQMARDGLLSFSGSTLTLTDAGQTLVRVVAAAFDSYRSASPARHAVAV